MTAIIHTESTWRYVLPVSTCTAYRVQETARKCEAHDSFLITKVDHIIFYKLINNYASVPKFTQLRPLNSVEILTANRVRAAHAVSLLKAGLRVNSRAETGRLQDVGRACETRRLVQKDRGRR